MFEKFIQVTIANTEVYDYCKGEFTQFTYKIH